MAEHKSGLPGKNTRGDLIFPYPFSEGNNKNGFYYRNPTPVSRPK